MAETRLTGKSMEQRHADRLKNSGDTANADYSAVHGSGPRRTYTNIYHSGHQAQHGGPNKGEGDVFGRPRGPANNPHDGDDY